MQQDKDCNNMQQKKDCTICSKRKTAKICSKRRLQKHAAKQRLHQQAANGKEKTDFKFKLNETAEQNPILLSFQLAVCFTTSMALKLSF